MKDSSGSSLWNYDKTGQVLAEQRTINGPSVFISLRRAAPRAYTAWVELKMNFNFIFNSV